MENYPSFEQSEIKTLSKKEERVEKKIKELEDALPKGEKLSFIYPKQVFLIFSVLHHEEFYLKSKLSPEEIEKIHVTGHFVEEYLHKRGIEIKHHDDYVESSSTLLRCVEHATLKVPRMPPAKSGKDFAANDFSD